MNKILFSLLFFLPFLIFPIGTSPFESPKVYLAEIGIIVLILMYLSRNQVNSVLTRQIIPFAAFVILGVVHIYLSYSETVLFGNAYRMTGFFMVLLLWILSLLSAKIPIRMPSARFITILLLFHLLAAILIQTKMDYRAIGTLGEANSLAANTIFLLSLICLPDFAKEKRRKEVGNWRDRVDWWRILGLVIGVFILLFSGSRSGVIAFIILGMYWLLKRYSLKFAVTICLLFIAGSYALPFLQQNQVFENRATVWETSLIAGMQKPILGWGFGNTEIAIRDGALKLSNPIRFEYVDHSHNLFLEYWVQGGIVALMLLIYLISRAFFIFTTEKKVLELGMLLGLLTVFSFNPLSIALLIQFWWIIGQSLASSKS